MPTQNTRSGGGSEARLGDILVDLIRRVEDIESRLGTISAQAVHNEQETRAWIDGRISSLESTLWDRVNSLVDYRESETLARRRDPRFQTYTQPEECLDNGRSRGGAWTPPHEDRSESCGSMGTNELGYDEEYSGECACVVCQGPVADGDNSMTGDEFRVLHSIEAERTAIAHTATETFPSAADVVDTSPHSVSVPGWEYAEPPAFETCGLVPEITVTLAEDDCGNVEVEGKGPTAGLPNVEGKGPTAGLPNVEGKGPTAGLPNVEGKGPTAGLPNVPQPIVQESRAVTLSVEGIISSDL
jgi:hypothetical protein